MLSIHWLILYSWQPHQKHFAHTQSELSKIHSHQTTLTLSHLFTNYKKNKPRKANRFTLLSVKLTKHVSPNQFLSLFCQSFLYLKIDFGALSCYQWDRYILGWADTGLGELLVTPSINISPSFLCTINTNNNTLHCLVCSLFLSLDMPRLERS